MAVAFDASSLTPNLNLAASSASVSHTASGSNRWAIGVVLVRRTSGGAVSVTATYGGVSMDYLGDVFFNNDDPAATNTGCLWFFGLANPPTTAEDFEFTVPIDGSRSGEARGSIRTYTGVGSVGPFQSAAGTEAGTATTIAVPSATGRRAVGAMAHESTSDASSGFAAGGGGTATNVQRLNLNVSGGDAVVADSVGTAGLTFNGNRASGVDYCTCGIDLLEINVGTLTATAQRATFSGTGVQNPAGVLAATARPALFSGTGIQNPRGALAATATPAVAALTGTQGQAGVLAATVTRPIFSAAFGLAIPSSASVFTLSDLTFNLENTMPDKFLGVFSDSPYTMTQIRYPASTSVTSLTTGVVMLDEVIAAEPGQIIILAHGEGARVASRWMRQYEADGPRGALASRLMFILIGNPLSARGGYGIGLEEVDGEIGLATLTDVPWTVIDFARRYDGWADWPQDLDNRVAVKNADAGKSSLHKAYDDVDIYDVSHTLWTEDNTVFVLTQEPSIPYLKQYSDSPPAWMDSAARVRIEAAYTNRPTNDPAIVVTPPPNTFAENVLALMDLT